jgi:hypothetical protein
MNLYLPAAILEGAAAALFLAAGILSFSNGDYGLGAAFTVLWLVFVGLTLIFLDLGLAERE